MKQRYLNYLTNDRKLMVCEPLGTSKRAAFLVFSVRLVDRWFSSFGAFSYRRMPYMFKLVREITRAANFSLSEVDRKAQDDLFCDAYDKTENIDLVAIALKRIALRKANRASEIAR